MWKIFYGVSKSIKGRRKSWEKMGLRILRDFGAWVRVKNMFIFKKIIIFPGNLFYRKIWKIWPFDRFQSFCYSRTFTKFAALKSFIEPHLRIQGLIFILFEGSVNSYQIFLQKCSRIHFHKYFVYSSCCRDNLLWK